VRNDNGFTLLETLVALTIVALMITVSLPMLRNSGSGLDLAARQAETELRRAHATAIRTNTMVDVAIDTATGRIGGERIAAAQPPITLDLTTTIDQRQTQSAGTIRFFPDGGSTGGGLALAQDGRRMQVLVDWLTGRISLEK
jgi:general secretion pathway protein H